MSVKFSQASFFTNSPVSTEGSRFDSMPLPETVDALLATFSTQSEYNWYITHEVVSEGRTSGQGLEDLRPQMKQRRSIDLSGPYQLSAFLKNEGRRASQIASVVVTMIGGVRNFIFVPLIPDIVIGPRVCNVVVNAIWELIQSGGISNVEDNQISSEMITATRKLI